MFVIIKGCCNEANEHVN